MSNPIHQVLDIMVKLFSLRTSIYIATSHAGGCRGLYTTLVGARSQYSDIATIERYI